MISWLSSLAGPLFSSGSSSLLWRIGALLPALLAAVFFFLYRCEQNRALEQARQTGEILRINAGLATSLFELEQQNSALHAALEQREEARHAQKKQQELEEGALMRARGDADFDAWSTQPLPHAVLRLLGPDGNHHGDQNRENPSARQPHAGNAGAALHGEHQ